ncbi:MAG: terminase [Muribaculaceae bacterium]|nr:terminase [Muribaculaceae bacterium]
MESIIRENERRRAAIRAEWDPVSGKNSVGERFRLELSDYPIPCQYLPVSMKGEPLVVDLLEKGNFSGFTDSAKAKVEFLRLRMLHDFPFWAATAVSIKQKGGGPDISFRLNRPQRSLIAAFESQRSAGKPIRIILLKARQWGGSTCVQLYMAWLQMIHCEGLNSLIIAHQGAGSDEIKDMFDRMLKSYPAELLYPDMPLPPISADGGRKISENVGKSGQIMRVKARNCKIKIGSAERPDSCRGGDYNLVHLSEVGIWRSTDGKSPEDIVRSACGGILYTPLTMIVYESTANGTGNFFHREYLAATRGESQFSPIFIPWYGIDQYSLEFADETEREGFVRILYDNRLSATSTDRSESGQYLWRLWQAGATLEAIKWYIEERRKYNDHARMAAEYPSDELEAFAHSGSTVFDRQDIAVLREGCKAPSYRGEIISPEGEDSIAALSFKPLESGGLEIWDMPDDDGLRLSDRYVVVVDVGGRSEKSDWSVIAVFDRGPMERGGRPKVAAQWRGHCDWDQLAWRAARIAAYYDEALLVIESNSLESREPARMVDGAELPYILYQIRDAYPNLYARRSGIENLRQGQELRLGFHTNAATKPMIIATLIRVVRECLYEERSDAALDEFLSYERRPNGSYGAIAGAHDDLLMTRAIGLHIALHEMEAPRRRRSSPERRAGRRLRVTEAVF